MYNLKARCIWYIINHQVTYFLLKIEPYEDFICLAAKFYSGFSKLVTISD